MRQGFIANHAIFDQSGLIRENIGTTTKEVTVTLVVGPVRKESIEDIDTA